MHVRFKIQTPINEFCMFIKEKNISIDAGKPLDKIEYILTLGKLRT